MPTPKRGQVWNVRFDPAVGAEIQKIRPAVVIGMDSIGRLPLKIVVPITDWKPAFANFAWFVHLPATADNGLSKDSDAFQVKTVSETRFLDLLGELTAGQIDDVAAAVATCVGAPWTRPQVSDTRLVNTAISSRLQGRLRGVWTDQAGKENL
jgi:mRNA interferase MazF